MHQARVIILFLCMNCTNLNLTYDTKIINQFFKIKPLCFLLEHKTRIKHSLLRLQQ